MNGYFISITNNLLEEKHYEAMGNAVWLYMWLIDRMTEISEGQGIVNNGYPINYDMVREHLTTLNERTYRRMVFALREGGYINTHKAQHGIYVTINKAKKQFGKKPQSSPAKSVRTAKTSYAKNGRTKASVRPNLSASPAKSVRTLYKEDNNNNNTINNTSTASKSPELEKISKIYYQAIKSLGLPVKNHNTLKSKIKAMATETDPDKSIVYLEWIRDKYARTDWNFKPHLNEALDIYGKRVQIENSLRAAAKEAQESKPFRV